MAACPGRFISCLAVSGALRSLRPRCATDKAAWACERTDNASVFSHDSGCASAAALRFALCAYLKNIRYVGTFVNTDADISAHFILFRLTFAQIYPYQTAPKCRPMIGIPIAWPLLAKRRDQADRRLQRLN